MLAFLGPPGFIRNPEEADPETLLAMLGANSGNLMFQYAATKLLGDEKRHIGRSEMPYTSPGIFEGVNFLVLPAANHLRLGADWTGLSNFLSNSKVPLIILGLGAQSPKLGGERQTIDALLADPHVSRLADIIRDRAAFVSVRGEFSREVCAAFGIEDVEVLGCPSALINANPNLGQEVQRRLDKIKSEDGTPYFGLTAAAPFEIARDTEKRDLEVKLVEWLRMRGGLYFQQSGGVDTMHASGPDWALVPEKARKSIVSIIAPRQNPGEFWNFMERRGRFHVNAEEWFKDTARLDLVVGTRLHGNMAALAAGTPGVIIAHDSRTGELADTMHLPSMQIGDVLAAESLNEAVRKVAFDGHAFDAWRLSAAKKLRERLEAIGVTASEHLVALADGGPSRKAPGRVRKAS